MLYSLAEQAGQVGNTTTELGVGAILALMILREVFSFLNKKKDFPQCSAHSGIVTAMSNIKESVGEIKSELKAQTKKIDNLTGSIQASLILKGNEDD